MKTALVHDWLTGMRGGEKVLEVLCERFPDAELFTLLHVRGSVSPAIERRPIHTSALQHLPGVRHYYRECLPSFPSLIERFDLGRFDLVISSSHCVAKSVLTRPGTIHVCYCHTPMRYLWELYPAYLNQFGRNSITRALMAPVANYLRTWDYSTAARVDHFVANSWNVRRRIWKTYRRKAKVVYPPVAIESFHHDRSDGYFLMVAEMVAYKQLDYAIRTFAGNGRRLKIVGDGPEYRALRKLAAPNIEFCGRVSDEELRVLYARSSALVIPGVEDFGMTMVESLASGKPVVALGRGGAVEIVREKCGVLFEDSTEAGLSEALRTFDRIEPTFNPLYLRTAAADFSESVFEREFGAVLAGMLGQRSYAAAPEPEFTTSLQVPHDTRSARPL